MDEVVSVSICPPHDSMFLGAVNPSVDLGKYVSL